MIYVMDKIYTKIRYFVRNQLSLWCLDHLFHDRAVSKNKCPIFSLVTNVLFWFKFYLISAWNVFLTWIAVMITNGYKIICFVIKRSISTLNLLTGKRRHNYISNTIITTLNYKSQSNLHSIAFSEFRYLV